MDRQTDNAPKGAPPRAYSYVRMSSAEQLKGDSLRRQTEQAAKYAKANGLVLDDERLHDLGKSAFSGEHRSVGVLGTFLKRIEDGEIPPGSYLLVESLDRLSREAIVPALSQLQAIVGKGITVVTLFDGQKYKDLNDPMQMLLSIFMMSRAHEESKTKSQRVGQAWQNKRNTASTRRLTRTCPQWLRPQAGDAGFEPIPERVEIVQRIFNESAGGLGAYTIARRLNRDLVPPFGRSAGWQHSYRQQAQLRISKPSLNLTFSKHPLNTFLRDGGRMALIGYSRVSTDQQNQGLQIEALKLAGCRKIFSEAASGAQRDRPQLAKALEYIREGDTLVVWKMDRLARSLKQLIETVENLGNRGVGFQSLTEKIDTTTPSGKLVFHLFGALGEFERSLIRERTMAGLANAKRLGRVGGRPRAMSEDDIEAAKALLASPKMTVEAVAERMGVSSATLYRYVPGGRSGFDQR